MNSVVRKFPPRRIPFERERIVVGPRKQRFVPRGVAVRRIPYQIPSSSNLIDQHSPTILFQTDTSQIGLLKNVCSGVELDVGDLQKVSVWSKAKARRCKSKSVPTGRFLRFDQFEYGLHTPRPFSIVGEDSHTGNTNNLESIVRSVNTCLDTSFNRMLVRHYKASSSTTDDASSVPMLAKDIGPYALLISGGDAQVTVRRRLHTMNHIHSPKNFSPTLETIGESPDVHNPSTIDEMYDFQLSTSPFTMPTFDGDLFDAVWPAPFSSHEAYYDEKMPLGINTHGHSHGLLVGQSPLVRTTLVEKVQPAEDNVYTLGDGTLLTCLGDASNDYDIIVSTTRECLSFTASIVYLK